MIFTDLGSGESVFLDANTFVYYFAPIPQFDLPCKQLIERIENQEISGFTSTHVLTEVAHRIMTIEASAVFAWPFTGIAARLRRHPSELQQLRGYRSAIETVANSKIDILTIHPNHAVAGTMVSERNGLLSSDALIVAVMQAHGLINIASNDADFDRVPGIKRFAPA